MRPPQLASRIFLDGGNPDETRQTLSSLGFLDGQTTNPTLISRHPKARKRLESGRRFSREDLLAFYRDVVAEASGIIPDGSISVEVYADASTPPGRMLEQAHEMFGWIDNAHIKLPSSSAGFEAAQQALKEGLRINMTLCFSQAQAAAVYAATRGAERGSVFVSPFIGRLDDRGQNGMQLIENILKMYAKSDRHVEVLTASVRKLEHLLYAIRLGSDIITAPHEVLQQWAESGLQIPGDDFSYDASGLKRIAYEELPLDSDWRDYDIRHELTDQGIEKFSGDWNSLMGP